MTLPQRISRLVVALLAAATVLATASIPPPAQAQNPKVAYVYNSDTAARDSFVSELTLRGFDVTPVDLATAGGDLDPNFSQYAIIIIGHDTGGFPTAGWLGGQFAADRIGRSGALIVGVGIGGGQYFDLFKLQIGLNNGVIASSDGVTAINPGDPAWNTPNSVPLLGDGSVRFFSGIVGGVFANPPEPAAVTLIASTPLEQEGIPIYPIAAELNGQFPDTCFMLWGHRASPTFMGPAARDTFENLLRSNPCVQEQPRDRANVSLTKEAPTSVALGVRSMLYKLTVENQGRLPAPDVFIEDRLPNNVTLLSVTASQGSCRSGRRIVCSIGDLAGGASATVEIAVRPTETGELVNRAFAGGRFEDTNPLDNSASATTVVNQADDFTPLRAIAYRPVFVGTLVPLITKDLSVFGVEITQGIQCFDTSQGLAGCADNSLPMVARKGTTARIYLRINSVFLNSLNNVPVRLVLIDANNVEYVVNTSGKALKAIDRANASSSANVYFSVNFNNITAVRYYVIVDPNNTISETNEGNNRFPAVGTNQLNFTPSKTMKIVSQRLRYRPSGYTGEQYAGGWAVNGGAATWFEQLMPIRTGGITHNVASGYLNWTTSLGNGDGQHALIQNLNTRWIMQNSLSWLFGTGAYTGARHVYGWAPSEGYGGGHADMPVYPHAGGLGIVGIGTDAPGTSSDAPGAGALIFGHELIHDYDVKHTDTPDACGSGDDSSAWPYATSSIQEFGFNPITGKVYNPSNTHDVLSYCPAGGSREGWLSPYTWTYMFNRLNFNAPAQLTQTADTVLAVSLSVSNPALGAEVGSFDSVMKVDANAPLVTPVPGEYALELRNTDGKVLSSTPFTISFESEYSAHGGEHPGDGDPTPTSSAGAHMAIPWQDDTSELVILHNNQVIGSRAVSTNPPSIVITDPSAPETWQPGTTETITWQASDPDGDTLTYSIFYSRDGEEWELIATDLSETSFDVVVNDMAGSSEGRFRVVANDGVYIADDQTALISVPNQQPVANILNPTANAAVPFENLLVLQGFGSDPEDGLLPDISLVWSSDRAGELGSGAELPVEGLEKGFHAITLTVTDSLGQTSSTTTSVFIGERLWLPSVVR